MTALITDNKRCCLRCKSGRVMNIVSHLHHIASLNRDYFLKTKATKYSKSEHEPENNLEKELLSIWELSCCFTWSWSGVAVVKRSNLDGQCVSTAAQSAQSTQSLLRIVAAMGETREHVKQGRRAFWFGHASRISAFSFREICRY